ncbi:MAG: FkbM family methyltransferase [Planctomycetaceae bacterium]|nr:FkbM family methyltransferase [Planctomycetaceae bacterium]
MTEVSQAPSYGGRSHGGVTDAVRDLGRRLLPIEARRWLRHSQGVLLNAVTLGRGLSRTLPGGEVVRVSPLSRGLSWNLDEYRAFREATQTGATVCDIGANAGAYSLLFGRWVGSSGRVFAFEPSPATRVNLQRHLQLNGLSGVIEIVPAAVADQCTEAEFTTAAPDGMHRLATPSAGGQTVRVPVVTLDSFCAERNVQPTVIKIDVEGFELAVLRGARETLQRVGRNLDAFMEIHPSVWPEIGISQADVAGELARQGLEVVPLIPGAPIWTTEGMCLRLRRVR